MIHNLYTTLLYMMEHDEQALRSAVGRKKVNGPSIAPSRSYGGSNMMQMITNVGGVTRESNENALDDMIRIIENQSMEDTKKMIELLKIAGKDGVARFIKTLWDNTPDSARENAHNSLTAAGTTDSLLKNQPLYRIEVQDNGTIYNKSEGRYTLKWVNTQTNKSVPSVTKFEFKDAKILYLYFLRHPRVNISKEKMAEDQNEILEICNLCYGNSQYNDEFYDKLFYTQEKLIDAISGFVKTSKPATARYIKQQLDDNDEDIWYIIDKETIGKETFYSISLPDKNIILPDSLKF